MELIQLNKNTLKLIIDYYNLQILKFRFGDDISIYNKDVVKYLEDVVGSEINGKCKLINFGMNKKGNKAFAIYVVKFDEFLDRNFMVLFENFDACIEFSKALNLKSKNELIKFKGLYFFRFNIEDLEKSTYCIFEYMGYILLSNAQISYILEHGEVITRNAVETLSKL